ncbi:hypothetical protein PROFUN_15734 [Planoprotostelium fungivorum]|uniref:Uncharacterized protein n=1 Tax=Planoprotostelium fungivorum TaxID=1890364 RepID=A0A2P6MUR7_9EUKA|nr:hypothetical protein PROFUN_15734 [Planoprotostelium fungivorum]
MVRKDKIGNPILSGDILFLITPPTGLCVKGLLYILRRFEEPSRNDASDVDFEGVYGYILNKERMDGKIAIRALRLGFTIDYEMARCPGKRSISKRGTSTSQKCYQWIVDYIKKNPQPEDMFKRKGTMSPQMVTLLPAR